MDDVIGFAKMAIAVPGFDNPLTFSDDDWRPHYNVLDYEGGWDVLTLRSPGGQADSIFADPVGKGEFADTPYMDNFPFAKKLMAALHCPLMSVRLLNLKAGAVIKTHRDIELSYEKGEARLHFPLITNNRVEFYVNDVQINMQPGECWYINANLPHRVANFGTEDRIHLVVDCVVNSWLKTVFDRSEKVRFKQNDRTEETLRAIAELRLQQNDTAHKIADELESKLFAQNDAE